MDQRGVSIIENSLVVSDVSQGVIRYRQRSLASNKGRANIGLCFLPTVDDVVTDRVTDSLFMMSTTYAPPSEDRTVSHIPDSDVVAGSETGNSGRVRMLQSVIVRVSVDDLGTRTVS